jgi:MFS family permease
MTAVFFSATTAGALVAMVVGGAINEWVGWRWTLVIAAAPGFLLAVLLTLTVREPARGGMDAAPAIAVLVPPHFWSAIRMLFANPLYRVVAIASAIGAIEQFSIAVWAPTYAMRAFSLGTRDVGLGLGLALGLGSGLVMIATGGLGDRLTRRSPAAPVFLAAAGQLLCMPLLFLALSVHQFPAFCAIFAVGYGAMACGGAMTIAATQVVIPATLRATGATLLVMMATLAGFGLGPPLVGAISDHLPTLAPDARLRWALIGGLAFNAVSAVMLIVAARRRGRDHRNSVASKPGIATV